MPVASVIVSSRSAFASEGSNSIREKELGFGLLCPRPGNQHNWVMPSMLDVFPVISYNSGAALTHCHCLTRSSPSVAAVPDWKPDSFVLVIV